MGGEASRPEDEDVVLGAKSTAVEAITHAVSGIGHDLSNEDVFIVTGANSGIGREAARVLATENATVILGCRSEETGRQTEKEIREETKNDKVHFMHLDLGSFRSIEKFAAEFQEKELPLRCLINNAGVNMASHELTEEGYEYTWGVNHLGHFYLTELLLDRLKASVPSRVVNVSSRMYSMGKFDIKQLPPGKFSSFGTVTGFQQYSNSKLCNVLFSKALNRKMSEFGVTSYALHPGDIHTNIVRRHWLLRNGVHLVKPFLKTVEQGAATTIFCAVDPDALKDAGGYFVDCHATPCVEIGDNIEHQDELWELSERITRHERKKLEEGDEDWEGPIRQPSDDFHL